MPDKENLREQIAAVQHDIWSEWMHYLFSVSKQQNDGSFLIPSDKVARWQRQLTTPYKALTEQEQESDRAQADKILRLFKCGEEQK